MHREKFRQASDPFLGAQGETYFARLLILKVHRKFCQSSDPFLGAQGEILPGFISSRYTGGHTAGFLVLKVNWENLPGF